MRPQANRPAGPISAKYLARVLRDRYYLGFVSYNGEEYQGRHEPLVSAELFAKVQAVLDERLPKKGSRQRRHHHYLKGSLWCGRCHDRGVEVAAAADEGQGPWRRVLVLLLLRPARSCLRRALHPHRGRGSSSAAALREPATAGRLRGRECARCWRRRWPTRNAAPGWCTST